MDESRESELITRTLQGDGGAFESLVSPHLGLLTSGIRRILHDSEDVEDVLQEALLTIHRELHRFQGLSRFSTWAYRICVNETLMQRRRRMRQREEALETIQEVLGTLDASQESRVMDRSEADRFWRVLREALGQLSPDQRAVFILRDVMDIDTETAAQRLGITRGLVRQRLHRARAGLRGTMGADPLRFGVGA